MSERFDVVLVGGGHNNLVAAAYLARAGRSVCLLERAEHLGGCVTSEQLTRPGFTHDTMSLFHPLFHLSGAYADLGGELADHGLAYRNTESWTVATARRQADAVVAHREVDRTAAGIPAGDRAAYGAAVEGFIGNAAALQRLTESELHRPGAAVPLARLLAGLGLRGLGSSPELLRSARAWLGDRFEAEAMADLYAPWILHAGMGPDDAGGALAVLGMASAFHAVGMPLVAGGSENFGLAFARLLRSRGASVRCGAEVESIIVRRGRAVGVRTASGEEVLAREGIVASVTPTQLVDRFLAGVDLSERVRTRASGYRYNRRAGMQIHVALSRPVRWRDHRLAEVPLVHIADGPDGVSLACAQASAGLLPAEPTIACAQPCLLDPDRAPEGAAILWIQLQEVPGEPRGDAAGQIEVGGDGWTDALVDAYVERVLARIGEHAEGLADDVLEVKAISPPELERRNPNLVGGDIYAGDTALDQSFYWRGLGSHRGPARGLFVCGAATHPGPGLNAASGRIVAREILGRRPRRRQNRT